MDPYQVVSTSVADTMQLGRGLAGVLQPRDVLALSGDLGSGKTHLCKGIADGLGADPELVNSPTFVLLQHYDARLPIHHFDTYRLGDAGEFEDIGGLELLDDDGVCLIEWPERIAELLPERTIRIEIRATGIESRAVTISGDGSRAGAVVDAVRSRK